MDLSVVVPVYCEEDAVARFLKRTMPILDEMELVYEIIFVLDPSPDLTEDVIKGQIENNPNIKLIVLSRRFGQPASTMAGIFNCTGDACVVIDVDLQDPPELIPEMYKKMLEGYEVVYATRRSRTGETLIKRLVSYLGYKIINELSDVKIPVNTGDYRLMTRRVVEELRLLNESHGYLRGLVAFVGHKQTSIEFDRKEREVGSGKYNRFLGSLRIGFNGLIGFSSKPLFIMSVVGFGLAMFSFIFGLWYVLQKIIGMPLPPGLSTTVLVISFLSGVQLLGLGLIGEYVGRIYDEVKGRPQFIIDKKINFQRDE